MSEPGLRRIKELDRFRERLSEVVAADAIPGLLDTPNAAFGGLSRSRSSSGGRSTPSGT